MLDLPLFLFQQNLRRTADALIDQIKTSDVVLSLIHPERIVDRHSHMIVGLTLAYNFKLRASHCSLKYYNTVWTVYLLQCLVGSEHKKKICYSSFHWSRIFNRTCFCPEHVENRRTTASPTGQGQNKSAVPGTL
jgi:hypothetical protein